MYGKVSPLVIGLDTCARFRDEQTPGAKVFAAPAGLFNTGTNLLETLLLQNCKMRDGRHAHLWQVPWGKHNPVEWRGQHYAPSNKVENVSLVLPVVMVKDPLTWMRSMCRKPYAASFNNRGARCPSPVESTKTNVAWQPTEHYFYKSLIHLWSTWNRAYIDLETPRLMVSGGWCFFMTVVARADRVW